MSDMASKELLAVLADKLELLSPRARNVAVLLPSLAIDGAVVRRMHVLARQLDAYLQQIERNAFALGADPANVTYLIDLPASAQADIG